jgi:hypothetical protein
VPMFISTRELLEEECELDPDAETGSSELWGSFDAFTRAERAPRLSRTEGQKRLEDAGARKTVTRDYEGTQHRVFTGIKLVAPPI